MSVPESEIFVVFAVFCWFCCYRRQKCSQQRTNLGYQELYERLEVQKNTLMIAKALKMENGNDVL